MAQPQAILDLISKTGIVAGTRGDFPPETALALTKVLFEEGVRVFELTMNSTKPIAAMQAVKEQFGDKAHVGMGTVLSVEEVDRLLEAGCDFFVSPAFQPEVVKHVLDADKMMVPGIATPSEAVAAWGMGVQLLKFFPIGALGIDYFKAMYGPLSHMRFMCNGAINAENTHDFIAAGATAVGTAGWVTGRGDRSLDSIRTRAKTIMAAIHRARTSSVTVQV